MNHLSVLLRTVGLLALVCAISCTRRETRQEGGPSRGPEFRVRAVQEASLNGLDVLPLRTPADMDLARRNQIIAGYVNKQLPLRARVQLNIYNPGLEPVALSGFDYTVLIDGRPLGKNVSVAKLPDLVQQRYAALLPAGYAALAGAPPVYYAFRIDAAGTVRDARLLTAAAPALAAAILQAIAQLPAFEPALLEGQPTDKIVEGRVVIKK